MSELLVIGYPEEMTGFAVWNALAVSARAPIDAVAVSRSGGGRVKVQRMPRTPFQAVQSGLNRLRTLGSSSIGSHAIPAAAVDSDGIRDEFAMRFGTELAAHTSAVIVLIPRDGLSALKRCLARWNGTVLRSTLGRQGERELQRALLHENAASNVGMSRVGERSGFGETGRLAIVPPLDVPYGGARIFALPRPSAPRVTRR